MNRDEFFTIIEQQNFSPAEVTEISYAYTFMKEAHGKQKRDNGERYANHPIRAALSAMAHPPVTAYRVKLCLMHDVLEDRFFSPTFLARAFGEELVSGMKRLSKIHVTDGPRGVIRAKKDPMVYYQEIAEGPPDDRLAKFDDRLDNVTDMLTWKPERKQKYILETRAYILPTACATDRRYADELEEACRRAEAILPAD